MRSGRAWSIVALVFGGVCLLVGLALVGMYLYSAVLEPLGEPDQSLLFWLSPFLLVGSGALAIGVVVTVLGMEGVRGHRAEVPCASMQQRPAQTSGGDHG